MCETCLLDLFRLDLPCGEGDGSGDVALAGAVSSHGLCEDDETRSKANRLQQPQRVARRWSSRAKAAGFDDGDSRECESGGGGGAGARWVAECEPLKEGAHDHRERQDERLHRRLRCLERQRLHGVPRSKADANGDAVASKGPADVSGVARGEDGESWGESRQSDPETQRRGLGG